ncbi:uncharacterized protein LOC133862446 isoform X2 [Alnus glutinosa]|uniref:uncharacterized protein LOC133862446 isoform X2 n=1 Tax=Alnus glutinosa TaxID=3517 RepID=UPI002D76B34C|nr:uncharacterized protein LOC133862446 isoform X2 [Alnus glutinosa]
MGNVVGKAANGIGGLLGHAFVAPIKTIFGASCEGVCSGPWDVVCFIEHLCVSNLVKLLMVLVLCYIPVMQMIVFCYWSISIIVLLLIVQGGDLPMHRKKPLQDVLGSM